MGEETTPLQRKLAVLGKQLGIFSIAISVIVAASGWFLGKPLLEMFLTGVSLAVAVVPELGLETLASFVAFEEVVAERLDGVVERAADVGHLSVSKHRCHRSQEAARRADFLPGW